MAGGRVAVVVVAFGRRIVVVVVPEFGTGSLLVRDPGGTMNGGTVPGEAGNERPAIELGGVVVVDVVLVVVVLVVVVVVLVVVVVVVVVAWTGRETTSTVTPVRRTV